MEFFLLPLLLLAGLLTTLGDDDDGSGSGEDSDNDTLAGSGTDRIFGGEGDDDLTLSDDATGLGGVGNDTIYAQDDGVGYGLDGDDSLTGSDNATIRGGDGDDWLSVSGEASAQGGTGDDELLAERDAAAYGGEGNDTLTASENGAIDGGAGDDMLIYSGIGRVMSPEDGADIYVVDHASGGSTLGFGYQGWDQGDKFAIHLGTSDLSNFTFRLDKGSEDGASGPEGDITGIMITETLADGTTRESELWLRGVYGYNLRDIILYGEEIGEVVDWKEYFGETDFIEAAGTETVYGGIGNDHIDTRETALGYGGAGDDLMHAWGNSTAYGGAGDDRMSDQSITDVTLHGDEGNDILSARDGTAYGGDGDDHISVGFSGKGYGGAGDDRIHMDDNPLARPEGYGGLGNDTFLSSTVYDGLTTIATGGAGADLHLVENAAYSGLDHPATATITDFDPVEDAIGVYVFPEQQADITVTTSFDAATNQTVVNVVQAFETEPASQTIAVFHLQGQQSFDISKLRFITP